MQPAGARRAIAQSPPERPHDSRRVALCEPAVHAFWKLLTVFATRLTYVRTTQNLRLHPQCAAKGQRGDPE